MRAAAAFVLTAVLTTAAVGITEACGDKFIRIGREIRYGRYVAIHPATILVYGPARSAPSRLPELPDLLKRAGHTAVVVSKPEALAAALRSGKFDLVQSCFAMEALPDWDAFHHALAEAHLVLRAGGVLVMANTAHGNSWTCDSRQIQTLFVTSEDLRWHLADAGFSLATLREIQSSDVSWRDQGYNRVILSKAIKA